MRVPCAVLLILCAACDDGATPPGSASDAGAPATARARGTTEPAPAPPAPPPPTRPRGDAPAAGEEVSVPAGVLHVGSRPGELGRDPRHEADLVPVDVPAFRIDRLPYPNDPERPPSTRIARDEAAAACAAEGKRICTELEWERACRGDGLSPWPGGELFDVELCSIDPLRCASPFDVLSMGVAGMEWTASDVTRGLGSERYAAVARGGLATEPPGLHRCGGRRALDPTRGLGGVGFRCCRGQAPDIAYPEEEPLRSFRVLEDVDDARLREILASVPELSRFAADFELVSEVGLERALGRGGVSREEVPWNPLVGVLRWAPVHGEEAWVFAGTGAGSAVLAVIHPMPDGTFVHGASFVLAEEPMPIAIAWDYGSRRAILWSACWGCVGEGGSILYREDHTIVVVQR